MKVFMGSDHAGYKSKEELIKQLEMEYKVFDMGPYELDPDDDYPEYAKKVSLAVVNNPGSMGLLICHSGEGMTIAANKIDGIRAITAFDKSIAELSRKDNDSNVLSLASRDLTIKQMYEISKHWLDTPFSELERHKRRIEQIARLEEEN